MKQPSCPIHGFGRHLVNAGAPFIVRCVAEGSCGVILERCHFCKGGPQSTYCLECEHTGWQVRTKALGSALPVR